VPIDGAKDEATRAGASKDGASKDGASKDGASKDGASKDGASNDGASKDGASNDGAFGLALILAALAGWVDAAGIAGSGGIFLSFMSGNTTDLAASLVQQDWLQAKLIGAVLGTFVAGVMVGELLEPLGGRFGLPLILAVEAVVLGLGAALHWRGVMVPSWLGLFVPAPTLALLPRLAPLAACPLVFAMGLQNATMHRAGGIGIGLTYVTGTLVQFGKALAGIVRGNGGARRLVEYGAVWLSLALGAALGTAALSLSIGAALSVAASVALCLSAATAFTATRPRRG
jgi:uncharacterized membrane protein YoaK (UPF0700 family)